MRARHLLLLGLLLSASLVVVCAQDEDVIAAEDSGSDSDGSAEEEPEPASPPPSPPPPKRKAATVLSVDSAEAQLISAAGKKKSAKTASFGSVLLNGAALDGGASIEVTFTPKTDGAASKPQQAMVMLTPVGVANIAAYAVAKARKDGSHVAVLSQSIVEKQLGPVGGKLEVTLLLGDPEAPKGVRWELGSVVLPTAEEGAEPAPAYRSARVQQMTNLLPNIAHTFRAPEKRPPAVVSLVFTGLALAPLPVLVLWLLASGALSMPAFPSGPAALWALLFHGGIGALLVLYWLFWTKLNLAQTLPLAVGIGLATAAVGFKALSALADARLQSERAAATPAKKTN